MKHAIAALLVVGPLFVATGCTDPPAPSEALELQQLHQIEEEQRGGDEFAEEVEHEVQADRSQDNGDDHGGDDQTATVSPELE